MKWVRPEIWSSPKRGTLVRGSLIRRFFRRQRYEFEFCGNFICAPTRVFSAAPQRVAFQPRRDLLVGLLNRLELVSTNDARSILWPMVL